MKKSARPLLLFSAAVVLLPFSPQSLSAQLVRQDSSSQAPPADAPKQTPSAKRRIAQEVQITGHQLWSETGIDVQPGVHIVVTATRKLHYVDAKDVNGPEGIIRGSKDILR